MNKAGTNIGMDQWMATLAIQPVIQTLLLVRLDLLGCSNVPALLAFYMTVITP